MKITINVPARLARDILSGAHCGYWLDGYEARMRGDGSGLHIGAPVVDHETESAKRPRAYVGAKEIAGALALMLVDKNHNIRECAARAIGNDGSADGPDMDTVLQFAAYGEAIWG